MSETDNLPPGVTAQQTPDGTAVWFFPFTWSTAWQLLLVALVPPVFTFIFFALRKAPFWFLTIPLGWFALAAVLHLVIYRYQRATRVCVSAVAIYFDAPFRRVGLAWDEVSSLCILSFRQSRYFDVRGRGKKISFKLGKRGILPGVEDERSADFLIGLLKEKFAPALNRRLDEIIKEQKPFEISPPPANRRHLLPAFVCLLMAGVWLWMVLRGSDIWWFGGAVVFLFALLNLRYLIIATARWRFKKIIVSPEGLSLGGGGKKYSWSDVKKIEGVNETDAALPLWRPLKIWLADSPRPILIPSHAANFNLLLALLKQKNPAQRTDSSERA
jgi:hypothetical protein